MSTNLVSHMSEVMTFSSKIRVTVRHDKACWSKSDDATLTLTSYGLFKVQVVINFGFTNSRSCDVFNEDKCPIHDFKRILHLSHLMRLRYFSSSVNSFFKCACAAIRWGLMSDFWSDSSSSSIFYVCEQRWLWRDCADAQAHLSFRWSPIW